MKEGRRRALLQMNLLAESRARGNLFNCLPATPQDRGHSAQPVEEEKKEERVKEGEKKEGKKK